MSFANAKPLLLVVEDSPEDFALIGRGLNQDEETDFDLQHCVNGDDAMDFLLQRPPYFDVPIPALIILDLNLPGSDGRAVLAELQRHPSLCMIPTVVFSNSNNINDVNACYALGANSFIEKPLGPKAFAKVMAQLRRYWLELVRQPDVSVKR